MKRTLYAVLPFMFVGSLACAGEPVLPARQIRTPVVAIAWQQTRQDLSLRISGTDRVQVGSLAFDSAMSSDFVVPAALSGPQARLLFRPHDGFDYWVSVGGVSAEIEVPSTTVKNRLYAQSPGIVLGCGVRAGILPDTIVTPAVAVEAGVRHTQVDLTALRVGDQVPSTINDTLFVTEYAAGVVVSRKYARCEPFAAARITRTQATLRDRQAVAEASGSTDAVVVALGSRVFAHPGESLTCEARFVGETGLSIGWNIEF